MLQGHVDVLYHFRTRSDRLHQLRTPMRGMRVEKPDPEISRNSFDPFQQPGQSGATRRINRLPRPRFLVPEIHSIIGRVLTNQVNLLHPFTDKMTNFGLH